MQELFDLPDQYDQMLNKGIGATGNDKHFFIKGRLDLLFSKIPKDFRVKRILDFGCGTGATSSRFSQLFSEATVIGTDVSDTSIEFAKKTYSSENLQFITIRELENEEKFDLIYLNCVLHHIEPKDRNASMNLLFSLGHSNSLFWIFENNPANPGTQWAMYTNPFDKGVVKIWPGQLAKMANSIGFQIIETNFIFYFPQWLSIFRPIEKYLIKLPFGGQYGLLAKKA